MRSTLLITSVLAIAACGDRTSPTGPSLPQSASAAASARALRIAVDDAVDRLFPGLAADAAGPIGTSLRRLDARLREPTASAAVVRDALASAREAVAALRAPGRVDSATLAALSLELDVAQ